MRADRLPAPALAPPEPDAAALLRCDGLVLGFRRRALLPPFDLTVGRGEILLVVGRNGSGKTTFARTLLGLTAPVGGTIERITERLAYVPQATSIDPAVPVRAGDLVAWGRLRGWRFFGPYRTRADRTACEGAMADLDVADLARRRLLELSGGQAQRVLLSRVLASDAELAVLDEPTAAMDATSELAAFHRLRELVHERGIGLVVITHEVAVAAPFADRIAFFDPDDPVARSSDAVARGHVHVGPTRDIAALPRFRALFGRVELEEDTGAT